MKRVTKKTAHTLNRKWAGRHVIVSRPATDEEAAYYESPVVGMECIVGGIALLDGKLFVFSDDGQTFPVDHGTTIRGVAEWEAAAKAA